LGPARIQPGGWCEKKPVADPEKKKMNYQPGFVIKVGGSPKTDISLGRLKRLTQQKVLRIDSETKIEERNFAGLNYTLTWTGIVKDIYKLTLANRSIIEYAKRFLDRWEYKIKITIEESGE